MDMATATTITMTSKNWIPRIGVDISPLPPATILPWMRVWIEVWTEVWIAVWTAVWTGIFRRRPIDPITVTATVRVNEDTILTFNEENQKKTCTITTPTSRVTGPSIIWMRAATVLTQLGFTTCETIATVPWEIEITVIDQ